MDCAKNIAPFLSFFYSYVYNGISTIKDSVKGVLFVQTFKKWLNKVFIEGLSGMATGLFATLIIGTIIQQIGLLVGGSIGDTIYLIGKMGCCRNWRRHWLWRCPSF